MQREMIAEARGSNQLNFSHSGVSFCGAYFCNNKSSKKF
uniref:Uncharacterized protein n=1 Tax=Anguilla anguilla TaxID=7936 RepID=A0A0E9QN10_ANGAN